MKSTIIESHEFRIKKMNAIEALALRMSADFSSVESATKTIASILERVEVKAGADQWFPVKEKGANVYYPAEIENDSVAIKMLINKFMNEFMTPFFENSDGSNE